MQANGQKEQVRNPINMRLIQDKFSHYGVEDAEEYKKKLKKMTKWDLSEEAIRNSLPADTERERTERKLLEQFKKDKLSYEIAAGKYTKPPITIKEPTGTVKEMLDFARS